MSKILKDLLSLMDKKSVLLNEILIILDKINPDIAPDLLNNLNSELNAKFNDLRLVDETFFKIENSFKNHIEKEGFNKILKSKFSEHEKLANLIQRKTNLKMKELNSEKEKLLEKIEKVNSNIKKVTKFDKDKPNPQIFEEEI